MEMWAEVRRRVLTGELSKRAACQEYGINWRTLGKMLAHVEPPGYRRKAKREQPVLGPHVSWIHEVLEQDKQEPKKQRHTAKRLFSRSVRIVVSSARSLRRKLLPPVKSRASLSREEP